jgi:hypothetical protein
MDGITAIIIEYDHCIDIDHLHLSIATGNPVGDIIIPNHLTK